MLESWFHEMLRTWFDLVRDWGYSGVFFLMALESSIVPVPSEVVMPPAAFWASQGKMTFWGVVLAGTAGSYFGSILNYWVARLVGYPLVVRYGKYVGLGEKKILMAHEWVERFGSVGIFVARLLPVVRHLISIPAGILKMGVWRFSVATTLGAFLWCTILSWFGQRVIGDSPQLLDSPEALIAVSKQKLWWLVPAAAVLLLAYALVVRFKKRVVESKA